MRDHAIKGRSGTKKLTAEQVREIRRRYAEGVTTKVLAGDFSIHVTNVWLIVTRKAWKHVD